MDTETAQKGKMDIQEMMAIYQKLAIPGAPHQLLGGLAGSWDTRIKSYCTASGKEPEESTGTCEYKLLLGGRFLQQEYAGEMMGTPFTGIGITGYDNHKKMYVSVWMDSMGTAILYFEGSAGADGKTITQECCYDDPIKGSMNWRSVTRIMDDDTHRFEMFGSTPGGIEEKMMEITYTRKK